MNLRSNRVRTLLFALLAAGASLAAASCSSEEEDALPTVDCATAQVPTFSNVSALSTVCSSCHSSTKTGTDRENAPVDINFDMYTAAKSHAQKAVSEVYGGSMPPNGDNGTLTDAQKQDLYAWGLCGTPQ